MKQSPCKQRNCKANQQNQPGNSNKSQQLLASLISPAPRRSEGIRLLSEMKTSILVSEPIHVQIIVLESKRTYCLSPA